MTISERFDIPTLRVTVWICGLPSVNSPRLRRMQNSTKLIHKLPLGFFPTPVVELKRLSRELGGPTLFMKRDDNTGLGMGGNKTRKLEYLLANAIDQGADTIITAGAMQSNHCRQTAAAAASLGLECHLVLGGEQPNYVNGNLLLDQLFACHIHWAGENRKGEDIPDIVQRLNRSGKNVYVVPYGGSNVLGALGFVDAFEELLAQREGTNQPLSHIVFASSSGGTHSGLVLGNAIHGGDIQLIGINIDKEGVGDVPLEEAVLRLANEASAMIGAGIVVGDEQVILNSDYVGDGYGVIGDLEIKAMQLTAQLEGILLDPVYTARAMGGLIDLMQRGYFKHEDNVLFWHTGGAPALFAHASELTGSFGGSSFN